MFTMQFRDPRIVRWQARLARVPRWAWIALFIVVGIPAIALMVFLVLTFIVSVLVIVSSALLIGAAVTVIRGFLFYRRQVRQRRIAGGQIVVRSVRVVDP